MNSLRNIPCWCGSGLKYKKCHLNRETEKEITENDVFQSLKATYKKKICSMPEKFLHECFGRIVRAHSISKSSSLKEISEKGHVLCIKPNLKNLEKNSDDFILTSVGINRASTFSGFCSKHDKEFFSSIENKLFKYTSEQCFLLSFRSISRELYVKESMPQFVEFLKKTDKGKDLNTQLYTQELAAKIGTTNELSLNDLRYIKSKFDESINFKKHDILEHHVFRLKEKPNIMSSAIFALEYDFQGNNIQTLNENPECPDYIILNCFSSEGNGYFIISSLKEHSKTTIQLIDSLNKLEKSLIGDAITQLIVSYNENFYLSPLWWNKLKKAEQNKLFKMFRYGIDGKVSPNALILDNNKFEAIEFDRYLKIN